MTVLKCRSVAFAHLLDAFLANHLAVKGNAIIETSAENAACRVLTENDRVVVSEYFKVISCAYAEVSSELLGENYSAKLVDCADVRFSFHFSSLPSDTFYHIFRLVSTKVAAYCKQNFQNYLYALRVKVAPQLFKTSIFENPP